ncbi:MAG: HAMP domain-containing histidine kinase [Magnetococcales bacterium]|nr:HAMP domain-containing histidine kinase [Magnetococcales bacterium]
MGKNTCRAIVENNVDGIMVVDRCGLVRYANPSAIMLFGRGAQGILNQELGYPLVAGESAELDIVHTDRQHFVAELRTTEIVWEDDERAFLVSLRDITERHCLLEQLKDALHTAETSFRSKERFLSSVSHELRTPLNAVISLARLLLDGAMGPLNVTQKNFLRDVLDSGQHLLSKVSDMLDLADMESGQCSISHKPVSVRILLANVLRALRSHAVEKGIQFTTNWVSVPKLISTDEWLLERMAYNLLYHVVQQTQKDGTVHVVACQTYRNTSTSVTEKFLLLSVTGQRNMDESQTVADPDSMGHDLGMNLVQKMAGLLGGRVWVEKPVHQQGHTFHVEILLA